MSIEPTDQEHDLHLKCANLERQVAEMAALLEVSDLASWAEIETIENGSYADYDDRREEALRKAHE